MFRRAYDALKGNVRAKLSSCEKLPDVAAPSRVLFLYADTGKHGFFKSLRSFNPTWFVVHSTLVAAQQKKENSDSLCKSFLKGLFPDVPNEVFETEYAKLKKARASNWFGTNRRDLGPLQVFTFEPKKTFDFAVIYVDTEPRKEYFSSLGDTKLSIQVEPRRRLHLTVLP